MLRGTSRDAAPGPSRLEADAQLIRGAMAVRAQQIRDSMAAIELFEEIQEQEPRGIIRTYEGGKPLAAEFFESTFSADQPRFLEEYLEAARVFKAVSLYYPALGFPEDYVVRMVQSVEARSGNRPSEVSIHGFLYDPDGQPREVA